MLENNDVDYDYNTLCHIHKLVADKLVLDQELGKIRTTPVNIGGTSWKPQFPIESQIKEELETLLNQENKTKTEIAIEIMLSLMRRQIFIDGNKRVAMLFANKIMIDNGCGIITIAQENQEAFYEKLIRYYESGNMQELKQWIYDTCIDGIKLN
ncbi:MAG: Fic family protein [Bacilli bacterium]